MAPTTAVDVDGISKQFRLHQNRPSSLKEALIHRRRSEIDDFWALRDVSFAIPKGSFYGLIGHNGSGKSTLLRLIAGIHEPTSGTITANGRISALLELGAGFHPDLTGRENIFLNGAILGLSNREIRDSADSIIEFSGLQQFIDTPVKAYSSGMHVRLGFAISVNVDPEILLIDEVIAVGDEEFQRRCFDHLYALRQKGVTIVLVSHDSGLVQSLCDEVAWLDHGQLAAAGDPATVVHAYLRKVDSQEAQRLSDEEPSSPVVESEDEGVRRGSGEIRIVQVEYLAPDSTGLAAATTGEPFTIRLWYDARLPITDPAFSVGIHHENGTFVTSPDSRFGDVKMGQITPGKGYIDVSFDRWSIQPGQYFVSTAINSSDLLHTFDAWDRSHKLVVQPGESRARHGLIDLPATWHPPVADNAAGSEPVHGDG